MIRDEIRTLVEQALVAAQTAGDIPQFAAPEVTVPSSAPGLATSPSVPAIPHAHAHTSPKPWISRATPGVNTNPIRDQAVE